MHDAKQSTSCKGKRIASLPYPSPEGEGNGMKKSETLKYFLSAKKEKEKSYEKDISYITAPLHDGADGNGTDQ
jgi:hypothetical protein